MKIVTVVGARPQFIKATAVSRALRARHTEILVHTGQHYDYEMSGVFFDGLDLPAPDVNLNVGSGSHAGQTAAMLKGIEDVLLAERPDWLLTYGDTNSTLAAALAASKASVPIAHVEAGLRSFNRRMPEEINRVVADHLSTLLLCPSDVAVRNLDAEGISSGVHIIGDVMLDVLRSSRPRIEAAAPAVLSRHGLERDAFFVATVHRSENTDDPRRLRSLVSAFNRLDYPVLFPVHPRSRKALAADGCRIASHVHLAQPVGYVEMMALASSARAILTDSGGLQKEAYWLGVPCVTLRDETEWIETVDSGWNILAGAEPDRIVDAARSSMRRGPRAALYGDGRAAARCVPLLEQTPDVELTAGFDATTMEMIDAR